MARFSRESLGERGQDEAHGHRLFAAQVEFGRHPKQAVCSEIRGKARSLLRYATTRFALLPCPLSPSRVRAMSLPLQWPFAADSDRGRGIGLGFTHIFLDSRECPA